MQYTKLGRTGTEVSRLCLGTMNFGPRTSEADSFRIMDHALDAGINFFDTANAYGGPGHRGRTEEIVGRWLAQGGGRRERIVLATKVYAPMAEDAPNRGMGLSAYKIKREIDESLARLRTDRVDLYQMHHVDRTLGWEETWGAFEDLVQAGKVVYVGSSNFAAWDIAHAQGHARQRHFLGLVSEQHKYSLICRQPELEVLPCCKALGLAVIPWSPLGGGLFSGHTADPPDGSRSARDDVRQLVGQHQSQIELFEGLCCGLGEQMPEVALAWMLHNDAITAPIVGPRTMEQLDSAIRALDVQLNDSTLAKIDQIFPGPGGEAPAAYAW